MNQRIVSIIKGLVILLPLFGVHLAPEHAQVITDAAIAVYGAVQLTLDNKRPSASYP